MFSCNEFPRISKSRRHLLYNYWSGNSFGNPNAHYSLYLVWFEFDVNWPNTSFTYTKVDALQFYFDTLATQGGANNGSNNQSSSVPPQDTTPSSSKDFLDDDDESGKKNDSHGVLALGDLDQWSDHSR